MMINMSGIPKTTPWFTDSVEGFTVLSIRSYKQREKAQGWKSEGNQVQAPRSSASGVIQDTLNSSSNEF